MKKWVREVTLKSDGKKLNSLLEGSKKRLFRLEKKKFNNVHSVNELVKGNSINIFGNNDAVNDICQIRNVWTIGSLQQIIAKFLEGASILIGSDIEEDNNIDNGNEEISKCEQEIESLGDKQMSSENFNGVDATAY